MKFSLPDEYGIDKDLIDHVRSRDAMVLFFWGIMNGWTPISSDRRGVHLCADDGTKMHLPDNSNLNIKVFRSRIRTIVRHRDVEMTSTGAPMMTRADHLIDGLKLEHSHARIIRDSLQEVLPSVKKETLVTEGVKDVAVEARAERVVKRTSVKQPSPAPVPPVLSGPGKSEPEPVATASRRILKEEPWEAHGKNRPGIGTETYPSDAVMERTWSDGVHDFACRWPDCHYVSDVPRSTASHYGSHTRRIGAGRQPQPEADGVDPDWTPKQINRVNRLKREIDGALIAALASNIKANDPEFSEFLAKWIIDHRIEDLRSGTGSVSEDEGPWTAEQILDKIAALADRGRAHVLREQLDTLNQQLDQAESRADRAEGNLHALRDMLQDT